MRSRPIAAAVLAAALAACSGGGSPPTSMSPTPEPTPAPTPAPESQPVNLPEWKPGPRYGAWVADRLLPEQGGGAGLERAASVGQGEVVATEEPGSPTIYRGNEGLMKWPEWFSLDPDDYPESMREATDVVREYTHAVLVPDGTPTIIPKPRTGIWIGEMGHSSFGVAIQFTLAGHDLPTVAGFQGTLTGTLTDHPLPSADWEGGLVGVDPSYAAFRGRARLKLTDNNGAHVLSAEFDNFRNFDCWDGSCGHHGPFVHPVSFQNLEIRSNGTFFNGTGSQAIETLPDTGEQVSSNMRIEGGFFGPGHVEAAGVVTKPYLQIPGRLYLWAFGAKKQP